MPNNSLIREIKHNSPYLNVIYACVHLPQLRYLRKQYLVQFQIPSMCSQRAFESIVLLVNRVLGMCFKTPIHMIYSLVSKVHLPFLLLRSHTAKMEDKGREESLLLW